MIILPAIDIKDNKCVRLFRGDYSTASVVAGDAVETAKDFEDCGASWMHIVDLDGALEKKPVNHELILNVRENTSLNIEVGGGIRSMDTVDFYIEKGVQRVILGSAALHNPEFVKEAIKKYGEKIAIGIDARDGKVAAEGWTSTSEVDYIDFAKQMEELGAKYIIFTDISKDGTLSGPNLVMLDKINRAVSSNIIASGGVANLKDILDLKALSLYGAIAGKSIYSKTLDLRSAIVAGNRMKLTPENEDLNVYFKKSPLIPAVVQDHEKLDVLMLAYMNRESLQKTLETGYTWFYSRSRKALWNKGATSGNLQKVVSIHADCDDDTLLVKVVQKGNACHTGERSCFFKEIK